MGRGQFNPHDFGVSKSRDEFTDEMADYFNASTAPLVVMPFEKVFFQRLIPQAVLLL